MPTFMVSLFLFYYYMLSKQWDGASRVLCETVIRHKSIFILYLFPGEAENGFVPCVFDRELRIWWTSYPHFRKRKTCSVHTSVTMGSSAL